MLGSGQAQVSQAARLRQLNAVTGLVRHLTGEAMLLSLCPQVDPVTVAEQMTAGVDLEASPRYREVVERVLDELDLLELSGRTDWLAVPLPVSRTQQLREVWRATRSEVEAQLGLLPAPVSVAEEGRQLRQAARLAEGWPAGVGMRPASEAEILWIYGHSTRRGVLEPPLPPSPEPGEGRGRGRGAAALEEVVVREAGLPYAEPERGGEEVPGVGPFGRRWLQVATPWGESFQSLMVLSQMPEAFRFPGSEYLAALDTFDFPVDWVARLKVVPGSTAAHQAQKQAAELENQYTEYEQDPIGPPPTLDKATAAHDHYREELSDRTEVEVQAKVAMCAWGATPAEADRRASVVSAAFRDATYEISRPVGRQEELWYGMLPAARTPAVMVRNRQYLLSRGFAMAGPFSTVQLGDEQGPLFGRTTGGGARPVLVDWSRGPREEKASASAAWVGESGSGKTTAMKTAAWGVLAAGRRAGVPGARGRVVAVDRTAHQEWAQFLQACPGSTQVLEVGPQAGVSLDPLRMFSDPRLAKRFTQSFLTLLLGMPPRSEEGLAVRSAIATVVQREAPSMRGLLEELEGAGKRDTAARRAARTLAAFEDMDMSAALFDERLPALEAGRADSVVFAVHALSLPTAAELAGGVEKLEDEKVFGRAAMYLIAAVCRQMCFASPAEFCVAVWDECWWLTSSPEGLDLVLEMVRDGRKNNAAAFLASHDAEDIGPSDNRKGAIIRGLIPRKSLHRQPDQTLAKRGLEFLGLDPNDAELLQQVRYELSPLGLDPLEREARAGECIHRDLAGQISGMKVLTPPDEQIEPYLHSDPDAVLAVA